ESALNGSAGHSGEQIARAAVRIADAQGFEAVTMKRIAAELGAATMTLYYYVRGKADVVALMQDAVLAEILVPGDELPAGWRDATAAIARRTRQVLMAHPWSLSSLDDAQAPTPRGTSSSPSRRPRVPGCPPRPGWSSSPSWMTTSPGTPCTARNPWPAPGQPRRTGPGRRNHRVLARP